MGKKKYVSSEGIAFSEKKDLKKLRALAAKGWIVTRHKGMGYELEKGPAEDVIFSIDVTKLTTDEEDEYFAMFREAGWEHVSSSYSTHLFKAAPGTAPIYTDQQSEADKFTRLIASITPVSLCSFAALFIGLIGMFLTSGVIQSVFQTILSAAFVMAVLCVLMIVTLSIRKMRLLKKAAQQR